MRERGNVTLTILILVVLLAAVAVAVLRRSQIEEIVDPQETVVTDINAVTEPTSEPTQTQNQTVVTTEEDEPVTETPEAEESDELDELLKELIDFDTEFSDFDFEEIGL